MRFALIDSHPESRASLLGRVQEAIRQAGFKEAEISEFDPSDLGAATWAEVFGGIIGPSCYEKIDEIVPSIRAIFPVGPVGMVLQPEVYAQEGVMIRRRLNINVLSLNDIAQIAGFLIDCEADYVSRVGSVKNKTIVGVCQLKGGVGCTTVAAGLAACWAKHGQTVVAVDFDDVNPQLTSWARVGVAQRAVLADLLRSGEVPPNRINEFVFPVENFNGKLVVVGQPESYQDGFHFKANVIEGAPSSSEFVRSLMECLKNEFEVIVFDLGRSWGIATFTALTFCHHVFLVTDDDGMSVRRTLDGLSRLKRESDDSGEFDLGKWSVILNGYTGRLISAKDLALEIQDMELFPPHSNLWTLPFSETGRQWGAPGQSFFETADSGAKEELRRIAHHLLPFKYERELPASAKAISKIKNLLKGWGIGIGQGK